MVEAASEDLEVKRSVFGFLDSICPEDAVLASNTSSISISKIGSFTGRPESVVGMHFMNPVPVMPLVEIIRGLRTGDDTLRKTQALCTAMVSLSINNYLIRHRLRIVGFLYIS